MKKTTTVDKEMNRESLVSRLGAFFTRHIAVITCTLLIGVMVIGTASASASTSSADTLWNTVRDLIQTWVTRLGGVVMFVGGVMFGLGWKSEDAEQKSRGISTLVSGAIVVAVAALATTFFK